VALPGMTASFSPLPVIGVPIMTKTMRGIDSLLSIAQMPPGIPVATVSVNGGKNAGLLAATIIGAGNKDVRAKVAEYKKNLEAEILAKAEKLEAIGYEDYLKSHE
jgi:5-(carboxyamino)imidazole ribonucleotide mutase